MVSALYSQAELFPKKEILGLTVQLEQLSMEFMNQIAEVSTASNLREVRLKLSQALVSSSRISSTLSMAKMAFYIDDLKLQMAIKTIQVLIAQTQSTILVAPSKMSA